MADKSPSLPKNWTPVLQSALVILKGAINKALKNTSILDIDYVSKTKGKLTVEFEGEKVEESLQKQVEDLVNQKILENAQFSSQKLDRKEAEQLFGITIYEKIKPPSEITEITLISLKDWNVFCCNRDHVKTTGEVGHLTLIRINHRPKKKRAGVLL
eukprot:TRINITY_DN3836_c0_g1_i2.p1 TRINITY_DN3836_c0_g1~~TRINITY_DN3836_c0_g1_i2.p1  ORF type:complete len:157 (+),score=24.63 TRINITY_DN3836_c0_g1_i2:69-539(+)